MAKARPRGATGRAIVVGRRSRPGEMLGDDPLGHGAQGEKGREDGPLNQSAGAPRARAGSWRTASPACRPPPARWTSATTSNG